MPRRQAFSETLADLPARSYVFENLDDDSYLRDDFAVPPKSFGSAPFRQDKKKPWAEFYMGMSSTVCTSNWVVPPRVCFFWMFFW